MTVSGRPVRVEVWSDVQCIWCYIASPRLQRAIDRFGGTVQVTYRSFLLNPDAPLKVDGDAQRHHHKASNPRFGEIMAQLTAMTAAEGLQYEPDLTQPTNSWSAMEVLHQAEETGQCPEMMDRLFRAHFVEGRNIGDHNELVALAEEVGLSPATMSNVLQQQTFRARVNADVRRAQQLGATGAPFYTVDDRWGLVGAQSTETYLELFDRAASS